MALMRLWSSGVGSEGASRVACPNESACLTAGAKHKVCGHHSALLSSPSGHIPYGMLQWIVTHGCNTATPDWHVSCGCVSSIAELKGLYVRFRRHLIAASVLALSRSISSSAAAVCLLVVFELRLKL